MGIRKTAANTKILIKIEVFNRGAEETEIHVLPTLWFRNTWSWIEAGEKPILRQSSGENAADVIEADGVYFGKRYLYCENAPEILFTENESNNQTLYDSPNASPFVKNGISEFVLRGKQDAVNPEKTGTKAAAHYVLNVPAGEGVVLRLRLTDKIFQHRNTQTQKEINRDEWDKEDKKTKI